MADKKLYGWRTDDGKYRLSKFPEDRQPRPANSYDSMQAALAEAGRRGVEVEWKDGVAE